MTIVRKWRAWVAPPMVAVAGMLVAAACAPQRPPASTSSGPVPPVTIQQAAAPAMAPAPAPAAVPAVGLAAPAPGPNLLATTWPERLGIQVSALVPATGKAVLNPKPGDLWFFTNSSTAWGATNTNNGVWVIDAKTKQTVAEASPFDGQGNSSHGIAVSGDGRFIYLPELGNPYVSTPASDGSFILVTVPAPTPQLRDKMDGWVAKIDPRTWKVIGSTPMRDPIWAEVSLDNKFGYVTSGADAKIYKIDLSTMKIVGEVQTGPGPWGAKISYDQTKLYTADKGEGPGYNQQGRTSTIIDLQTMGVSKAVPIGLTTDHALLSQDGKEVWYTSNAEHSIYVLDTATDEIKTEIKDPADGDLHGGVWVQYKDDGSGGVTGEVVADYAGLHGSALAAQQEYVSEPAVSITLAATGFTQKGVTVPAGQTVRLTVKNVDDRQGSEQVAGAGGQATADESRGADPGDRRRTASGQHLQPEHRLRYHQRHGQSRPAGAIRLRQW